MNEPEPSVYDRIEAMFHPPVASRFTSPAAQPVDLNNPYLRAALGAEVEKVRAATEGTRNATLNEAAFCLGTLVAAGLDEPTIRAELTEAAMAAGLDSRETTRTIESGVSAGMAEPRAVPDDGRHAGLRVLGKATVPGTVKSPDRRVRLTVASTIQPRPVRWVWSDRIPAGEVAITPGRGGVGKSTFHVWAMAHLSRGTLPGIHHGIARACIIAAAEDSWERTIVPRLIAAGADLDRIYRVDVTTDGDDQLSLTLPVDGPALQTQIDRVGAALLSVDPLLSSITSTLDSHKDREVRSALEPLGRLADATGCAVLGNAHFNKSTGSDPLALVMGSAAFGNVARAALGFAVDPDADDGTCVISQVKNNLGRLDLPSLRYRIDPVTVSTGEGPADVGRLVMCGESDRSVGDILRDRGSDDDRSERDAAETWLSELLAAGQVRATEVYRAADSAGYSKDQAKRAKKKLHVVAIHPQIDGPWYWQLPLGSVLGSQGSTLTDPAPLLPSTLPRGSSGTDTDRFCPECDQPVHAGQVRHPTCLRQHEADLRATR